MSWSRYTGIPAALTIENSFPGLILSPRERAQMRGIALLGGAVRTAQLCAMVYGVVYLFQHGGMSGPIYGVMLAYLIGLAKPKLPVSVSQKIQVYLASQAAKENY